MQRDQMIIVLVRVFVRAIALYLEQNNQIIFDYNMIVRT